MLLQDTTHLIQGPFYQRGSPRQDPAGIGPHEDILTIVKRRKLQWYGHVSRSSDLYKTILQGTVKGGRRQGRQRKRWGDNIREWTGLEFAMSQGTVKVMDRNCLNWQREDTMRKLYCMCEFGHIYPRQRCVIINQATAVTPETVPSQKIINI